jgi:hypothetical protein
VRLRGALSPYPSCAGPCPCVVGEGGSVQDEDWSGAKCVRLLGTFPPSPDLNLKISVFFLFSHTLVSRSAHLALSFGAIGCQRGTNFQYPPTHPGKYGIWAVQGRKAIQGPLRFQAALRVPKPAR